MRILLTGGAGFIGSHVADQLLGHGPAKAGEQLRSCVDPSRAGRVLGWRPETSLAHGLSETLRFFGALPGVEV
jgi:nucleoside-diphosphate-sugar epimerase